MLAITIKDKSYIFLFFCFLIPFMFLANIFYGWKIFSKGFVNFFCLNLEKIQPLNNVYSIVSLIFVVLLIDFLLTILISLIVKKIIGSGKSLNKHFPHKINLFLRDFILLAFLEEFFARFLFLGIPMILFPKKTVFVIVIFFIGNSIWALLHLMGYEEKSDRHILRVSTQFIGGIIYGYVFLQIGFLGVVFIHFAFNVLWVSFFRGFNIEESVVIKS